MGEPHRRGGLNPLPAGADRSALLAEVRDRLAGIPPGGRVVLAVSGGPDSVALAHLVRAARPDTDALVGHVRHGWRDDAADARTAARHAGALGLPIAVDRVAPPASGGQGPEGRARQARYAVLARMARDHGAGWVLVGHSADDQAETVLLNVGRGAGTRGLAAMAVERDLDAGDPPVRLLRPLLAVRRADLRAVAAGTGLPVAVDPTNADRSRRRTRARAEVLPALARLSGGEGDPVALLWRTAALARRDADALDALAADRASRLLTRLGPVVALPVAETAALPEAVASRLVRRLLAEVRGDLAGVSAEAVAAVLALRPGGGVHVAGGVAVTCGGGWLAAGPLHAPAAPPAVPAVLLAVPGAVRLGALEVGAAPPGSLPPEDLRTSPLLPGPPAVVVEGGAGLAVRTRRPGDRLARPAGSRSLQDLLVDARVPRPARDLVPVVVERTGQVRWVAGVAAAAPAQPWHGPVPAGRVGLWLHVG